jgi:multiple sugar transport system permease protein
MRGRLLPHLLPYLLIAPSVIFLAALFLFPLVQTIALAFHDGGHWSVAKFAEMAGDLDFVDAVRNTFLLVVIVVPLQMVFALGMALMLRNVRRGRDLILWVWSIPLGISDLAAGLVWLAILTDRGYLNTVLFKLGVISGPQPWLTYETPVALFAAIVVAEAWRATAIVFLILVAGVQLIPKEYNEAAEIFGASPWQRLRRVTLPLLKPSLQTALILRTVLAFEMFAMVLSLGGQNFPVLMSEAFTWQNANQDYGVAAAYATLVMVVSLAATGFYLVALRVRPEERG